MPLPALATLDDLQRRLGGPITEAGERDRAVALLSDASTLVRHEAGRTWVDAEGELTAVPDLAMTITLAVAVRAFNNPNQDESAQLGAFSVRYADVWLTRAEADRLNGLTNGSLTSVDLTHGFGFDGRPGDIRDYVPVDYGGDWFPLGR